MHSMTFQTLLSTAAIVTLVGCHSAPKSDGHQHDHGHAHAPIENPTTTIDDERTAKTYAFLRAYGEGDFKPAADFFAEGVRFHPNSKDEADSFGLTEWYSVAKMLRETFGDITVEPMFIQTSEYSNGEIWTHVWGGLSGVNRRTNQPVKSMVHLAYQWDGDRVVEEFQYFDTDQLKEEMEVTLGGR